MKILNKITKETILVTGTNGFVGKALINKLATESFFINAITRKSINSGLSNSDNINIFFIDDFVNDDLPSKVWNNITTVVHLAAKVHQPSKDTIDDLKEYYKINTQMTTRLAKQAIKKKVKVFIFMSSIKVNGDYTKTNEFFSNYDEANPQDLYAKSKLEAENQLINLTKSSDMDLVIIRPPLVYGPGVKGNFLKLIKFTMLGFPLPFGFINNRRGYIFIDNLVDFIICCIKNPKARNNIFLVSDFNDISTKDLVKKINKLSGKSNLIMNIPIPIISIFLTLIGKKSMMYKLIYSLQVDITHTKKVLGWRPPLSVNEGLKKTINSYINQDY